MGAIEASGRYTPMANASPETPQSMAPMATPPPERTSPQGSSPESTPSMMVFISVAWGAGSSRAPNVQALPNSSTVAATAQQAKAAPRSCPSCCFPGVAPTRYPVLRSCEMSPALDAAMATTVPTVNTAAFAPVAVQPISANTVATPSSVTSVMPEVGCDETPTSPTMRAATATKSTPNTATPSAQTARGQKVMSPAKTPGMRQTSGTSAMAPKTKLPGRSRSVLTPELFRPRATAVKAPTMVGRPRSTVRIPATATAPAPM